MRNSLWLALLAVSISCSASTPASNSVEYLRCPDGTASPDTKSMSSIFDSFSSDNLNNCIVQPDVCAGLGANYSCDTTRGCCKERKLGCNTVSNCGEPQLAYCNTASHMCEQCAVNNTAMGDTQCADWAKVTQVNYRGRNLCLSGTCVECRTSPDCKDAAKPACDMNDHTCKGCTNHADCKDSQVCKLDPIFLKAGESSLSLGQCVPAADAAIVDNLAACDSTGVGKPFCQISQAITAGKSYITVIGHGGGTPYLTFTVNAGKQIFILGPGGRDVPITMQQALVNGVTVTGSSQLTLIGVAVTNNVSGQPAVLCNGASTLYVQNVLISKDVAIPSGGIYANMCNKVDIERTKITGAAGYGISVVGGTGHRVINNAIINGGSSGEPAGLRIAGSADGLFAFNTIASNIQGVTCETAATISDSIVAANLSTQVAGSCQTPRVVTEDTTMTMTKVVLDSGYKTGGDPRLTSSPINDANCIDKGMPDASMTIKDDYQPVKRPLGQGYDIGAFEMK